jgi:energy-coupling factor transporter ATP-binding protein EcfA2
MGQVVLIVGEPGLGKSRLVHTIKQIVMEQGRGKVPGAEIQVVNTSQDCSVVGAGKGCGGLALHSFVHVGRRYHRLSLDR